MILNSAIIILTRVSDAGMAAFIDVGTGWMSGYGGGEDDDINNASQAVASLKISIIAI